MSSIYQGHGDVFDISRTWRCLRYIKDMAMSSIYQGHGMSSIYPGHGDVFDISRTW